MIALFKIIINLIKKDSAILYPPMIAAFISLWLLYFFKIDINNIQLNFSLSMYFLISWILNIFIYLLTAELCNKVLHNNNYSFKLALKNTFLRFVPALIGSGALVTISILLLLATNFSKILTIAISPLIIIISLAYLLFPIVYVISEQHVWRIHKILFIFLKEKFKIMLNILFFIIFIIGIKLILTTVLQALPANFKSILIPLTEGFFTVITIFGIIIFWQTNSSKIKVKI